MVYIVMMIHTSNRLLITLLSVFYYTFPKRTGITKCHCYRISQKRVFVDEVSVSLRGDDVSQM